MSAYSITLDSEDFQKFKEVLEKAPQMTINLVKAAVTKTANSIRTDAIHFAPHRHGTLQQSIHTEPTEVRAGSISAEVGTNLEYGKYQEFGTGVYSVAPDASHEPIVITAKNKRALFWPGALHPVKKVTIQGIKPKLFMKQAFDKNKDIFAQNVRDALDNVIKFLAAS